LLRPPTDDFRVCLVLPQRPKSGKDDTRGQLSVLKEADHHGRLLVGTIDPPGRKQPPVYVHAKVGVIDDEWLIVGSANLNGHSLFNDTEVNLVTDDGALARRVLPSWMSRVRVSSPAPWPFEEHFRMQAAPGSAGGPTPQPAPEPSESRQ